MTFLDDVLYFVDRERGMLCHIEFGKRFDDVPINSDAVIVAGVGGCGNYRIFITDKDSNAIKVFNPISSTIQTLTNELDSPISITKQECNLYIQQENNEIKVYNLKEMRLESFSQA